MSNPLNPSPGLLAKLGSIIVHVDEGTSEGGHAFDVVAWQALTRDPEVREWLAAMGAISMVPLRRKP